MKKQLQLEWGLSCRHGLFWLWQSEYSSQHLIQGCVLDLYWAGHWWQYKDFSVLQCLHRVKAFSAPHPTPAMRRKRVPKELEMGTARTNEPSWPGDIPGHVSACSAINWERGWCRCSAQGQAGHQVVGGEQCFYFHLFSFLDFISLSHFSFNFNFLLLLFISVV